MQIIEAKLFDLKIDPSNVRKTDREPDEGLLASIRAKGLLAPLTVRPNGEGFYVTDGGRRLAALHILARNGEFDKASPIACVLREDDEAAAADVSLTTNFIREGMHPVDEYEAFAALIDTGKTLEDIAKSYGQPIKVVRQSLALGKLAPEIRQAWREDKIDDDAAEAFTLESDQKRQTELFNSLRKGRGLNHWSVKQAICGDERQARAMVNFVGLKAYVDAGGSTTQDLFVDKGDAATVVTDIKLLTKLYEGKLQTRFQEVKDEGWKWVSWSVDLPNDAYWWPSKAKGEVKADDRGKYGVIFRKGHDGEVEIKYGVARPENKATVAAKKAKATGTAVISAALASRLNDQITKATAAVLEHDSQLGLVAVCAALTSGYDGSLGISSGARSTAKFEAQFQLFLKKSTGDLHVIIAKVAAQSLSIGGSVQERLPLSKNRPGDRALLESLDPKKLNAALRTSFDAADYFAGVTAQVCQDAIKLCDPKYPFTGKEKKSELAKHAAKLVKESNAGGRAGYLPPEMRTAHYDGPATKAAKPAVASRTAKKTAKKAKR